MSALPVTTPTTDAMAPATGPVEATGRTTPLRIVTTPVPARPRHPLAPTSRSQALRRRATVAAVLLVALAMAVTVLVGTVGAAAATTPGAVESVPAAAVVVVQPGDTVWSIAQRHAPDGVSTASYAGRIVERNGLDGGAVDEWQVLRLP